MKLFDAIINVISHSKFYIYYVSQWPAPFNIVSFDAILLIILMVVIIRAIWDAVNAYRYSVRFRARQQQLQEERLDQEIKERERDRHREEDNDIIRQYLKFLSMASARNILGANPVSFEDFKEAIGAEQVEAAIASDDKEIKENKKTTVHGEAENEHTLSEEVEEETPIVSNIPIEEPEKDDPMSESEFSRIMNAIARNETAKKEAKNKENKKREQAEQKMKDLDKQVENSINDNEQNLEVVSDG